MSVLTIIRDCLDALLHPSARSDDLIRARHRAFIAPRLLGSLAAFAAFPIYLVARGAPGGLEVAGFSWLIAPILLSWFLSRTGRYESAHVLSSLALASLVMAVAVKTGGIASFAVVWLVILPIEAALSASRRVVAFAAVLAMCCAALLLALGHFELIAQNDVTVPRQSVMMALGVTAATLYAAALAFSTEFLARTCVGLIAREEERYRLLALNISDVISRHRANGNVQFVSRAAEQLLGVPVEQLAGHGLFDRVHVADRPAYLAALSAAGRDREETSIELRLKRQGVRGATEFVWVDMRYRPLESSAAASGETDVVAVIRDATGRKLQEKALDEAKRAAETAEAAKTRFLAAMSHELRTPLNAIIGFSEMISREGDLQLDAARRAEYAQLIRDSGQHLLGVVNGILEMSKMESGSLEVALEPFAARDAVINCCNMLALKARESGVDLVADVPKDLPSLTADPRAFRQIVLNLVCNAIKFTERGGLVTVAAQVEGDRLLLRITDTGIGIAEEDLRQIGVPFFQAGSTYRRRHEGTGLGLSIVKSLVALHGGEFNVQSKVDEGTIVTVALPLVAEGHPAVPSGNVAVLTPSMRQSAAVEAMLQPPLKTTLYAKQSVKRSA